jgi:hypothetical protein
LLPNRNNLNSLKRSRSALLENENRDNFFNEDKLMNMNHRLRRNRLKSSYYEDPYFNDSLFSKGKESLESNYYPSSVRNNLSNSESNFDLIKSFSGKIENLNNYEDNQIKNKTDAFQTTDNINLKIDSKNNFINKKASSDLNDINISNSEKIFNLIGNNINSEKINLNNKNNQGLINHHLNYNRRLNHNKNSIGSSQNFQSSLNKKKLVPIDSYQLQFLFNDFIDKENQDSFEFSKSNSNISFTSQNLLKINTINNKNIDFKQKLNSGIYGDNFYSSVYNKYNGLSESLANKRKHVCLKLLNILKLLVLIKF